MNVISDPKAYVQGLSAEQKAEFDLLFAPHIRRQATLRKIDDLRQWKPRAYQDDLWSYLIGGGKRACVIWHRRSGKDDVALNWACRAAHEKVGEYWHMLPEAAQGRKVVWDAVNPHTGRKRV